ncbi:hypothetical protein QFC22_005746 [Naganishia vaughanmartiniae]|uniref:Uncharacterized protein n=1 Tax=Naganishia vaughanmartiniae TaxID=1424756 RepID=A0ACC2WRA0_9TREE|nr:hypothetical protein QFC22_005746 [Naganishia vaughanmartiniae]
MKWRAGYMQLPIYGIIPVPYQLWTRQQLKYNNIYVGFLCAAFCLYDAVNLEEWLYWIYVVRAVRTKSQQNRTLVDTNPAGGGYYPYQSKSASVNNSSTTTSFIPSLEPKLRPSSSRNGATRKTAKWISSNVFIVWLSLSVAQTAVHFIAAFVDSPDVEQQSVRIYLAEGLFNSITAILSIILARHFPGFIRLVKETGASYEVISKLQFYHGARLSSLSSTDSQRQLKLILRARLAADLLFQVTVLSFYFAAICSWMLYLPVQWNKATSDDETGGLQPQLRRYTSAANRGRRTGRGLRSADAASAPEANVKVPASPTSFTSPSAEAYPYFACAAHEDAAQRRMMMSQHSEQHRTLIDLLRERGTISHDERLPEDDIFDDQAEAESGYSVGAYHNRSRRNDKDSDTIGYVGAWQQDADRTIDAQDEAFATALGEPLHLQAQLPAGVEPVYGAREIVERGPIRNALLPLILQNFDSPAVGFSRLSVPPLNVVINVSRDVEIDREDGDGRIRRMV